MRSERRLRRGDSQPEIVEAAEGRARRAKARAGGHCRTAARAQRRPSDYVRVMMSRDRIVPASAAARDAGIQGVEETETAAAALPDPLWLEMNDMAY